MRALLAGAALAASGCVESASGPPPEPGEPLATEVVEAPGHTGDGTRDVQLAVNGVRGTGSGRGSLDVFSLGTDPGVDDVLVLGWHGGVVVDVEGPDLAVFENPFDIAGGGRFMDPLVVEVSPDGVQWTTWPLHAAAGESWSGDPADWSGFAGLTPVFLHEEDNPVDPLSEDAGGDRFDLAELDADDPIAAQVLDEGARYVRLSAASLWLDPATGAPFPAEPTSNGPDIDGVYAAVVQQVPW